MGRSNLVVTTKQETFDIKCQQHTIMPPYTSEVVSMEQYFSTLLHIPDFQRRYEWKIGKRSTRVVE